MGSLNQCCLIQEEPELEYCPACLRTVNEGDKVCTLHPNKQKHENAFIRLLSVYLSTDPGSGERGQDIPPGLLPALCNVQYHQHQKSLTVNINDMYLTTRVLIRNNDKIQIY